MTLVEDKMEGLAAKSALLVCSLRDTLLAYLHPI
jgi:hypothetical protein